MWAAGAGRSWERCRDGGFARISDVGALAYRAGGVPSAFLGRRAVTSWSRRLTSSGGTEGWTAKLRSAAAVSQKSTFNARWPPSAVTELMSLYFAAAKEVPPRSVEKRSRRSDVAESQRMGVPNLGFQDVLNITSGRSPGRSRVWSALS